MNKSTIPVAVLLSATALQVQASDANMSQVEVLAKCDAAMKTVMGYSDAVQKLYLGQLTDLYSEIEKLPSDVTQTTLDEYEGKIDNILEEAEKKDKELAPNYYNLVEAKEAEEAAKKDAEKAVSEITVEAIRDIYQAKLDGINLYYKVYFEEEWKAFHNNDANAAAELEAVKNNTDAYNTIAGEAVTAVKKAQEAQSPVKDELDKAVTDANGAAESALATVSNYFNVVEGDENVEAIKKAIAEYDNISREIAEAYKNLTLTEEAKAGFERRINESKTSVETIKTKAYEAAVEAAANYKSDELQALKGYEEPIEGDDEKIRNAKKAVNSAIADANTKAEEGKEIINKGEARTTFENELDEALKAVGNAKETVTTAQNNYDAWTSAKGIIAELRTAYNTNAITLSTLKADGKINDDIYNDANDELNRVSATITQMEEDNDKNYDDGNYENGTEDGNYTELTGQLTVKKINSIVENAQTANVKYAALNSTLSNAKGVADEIGNDTMQNELKPLHDAAVDAIKVYTSTATDENYNAANDAVTRYKKAVNEAKTQLDDYNGALSLIDKYRATLKSVPLPTLDGTEGYEGHETIKDLIDGREDYLKQLEGWVSTVNDSFEANPRRCSGAYQDLKDSGIADKVGEWKKKADEEYAKYKEWQSAQTDETIYKLAQGLVTNLNSELEAAIAVTAKNAKGYDQIEKDIEALNEAIEMHKEGHGEAGSCIDNYSSWETKAGEISAAISTCKQAYIDNNTAFETQKKKLDNLVKNDYYKELSDKSSVDASIEKANEELDQYNADQTVVENQKTINKTYSGIRNEIVSQLGLQKLESIDFDGVKTILTTTEGYNPNNVYTDKLTEYKSEADALETTFEAGITYSNYKKTYEQQITDLINNVNNLDDLAKENYDDYKSQMALQDDAKSVWAGIYSQVGALYTGEEFAGAQALYQGQLNGYLKEINAHDTTIKEGYDKGEAAKFGEEAYDADIQRIKEEMNSILEAAQKNWGAYDDQTEALGWLTNEKGEGSYDKAYAAVTEQLENIDAALEMASSDDDTTELETKKTALEEYRNQLDGIKKTIDDLATTVGEKVNLGESVDYADEFNSAVTAIDAQIIEISGKISGSYNEAVTAHNTVVINNFNKAYSQAKATYRDAINLISKYGAYKHALDDAGNSAYAPLIEATNEALFKLYDELRDINKEATGKFADDNTNGNYTDTKQKFKKSVEAKESEIKEELDKFLRYTQELAINSGFNTAITKLDAEYNRILYAIGTYESAEQATAIFNEYVNGVITGDNGIITIYDNAMEAGTLPQVIDALNLRITTDNAESKLSEAYNEAANVEALQHINNAQKLIDDCKSWQKVNGYNSAKRLNEAIKLSEKAVADAEAALEKSYEAGTVPADLETIKDYLKDINSSLETAKGFAPEDQAEAEANKAVTDQFDEYDGQIRLIENGEEDGSVDGIIDYENSVYANNLTDLITEGKAAVEDADDANELGKSMCYVGNVTVETGETEDVIVSYNCYTKLFGILVGTISKEEYEKDKNKYDSRYNCQPVTETRAVTEDIEINKYISDKIQAAKDILGKIESKVSQLEAEDARTAVATLKAEAETLIPLWNRAMTNNPEAEESLNSIYDEIDGLRTQLTITEEMTAEDIENLASEDNQNNVRGQIADIKSRIEALDTEVQAYNSLNAQLEGIQNALAAVQTTIKDSEFSGELNSTFGNDINRINGDISDATDQLKADHTNNVCGKDGAWVTEASLNAISESITALEKDVNAKIAELQKAKEDAATRQANTEAYNAAKSELNALYESLQTAKAEIETLDVQNSFIKVENAIEDKIDQALSDLNTAYETAQSEEALSTLDTSAALQSVESINGEIEQMLEDAKAAQAQYQLDLQALQERVAELEKSINDLEISDIAAANEEVQAAQNELSGQKQKIDEKMSDINPFIIDEINGMVDDAEQKLEALKALIAEKDYLPGDIDLSGSVDIDDIIFIRDLVLGLKDEETLSEKQVKAADVNEDGRNTVADLVMINNIYVYGNKYGAVALQSKDAMKTAAMESGTLGMQISAERMDIALNSEMPYAAIQMDITVPAGVVLDEVSFAGATENVMVATNLLENGNCRIVMYTADGSAMLIGSADLLNIKLAGEGNGIVSIDNIIAATSTGEARELAAVNGNFTIATGISAIDTENEANGSIFDTNGVVRQTLKKGVNIVRDAAGRVKKILVK